MGLTLEDALWNAILFTDRKSHVGDAIRVDEYYVTASDDHVIIRTRKGEPLGGDDCYPTIKQAKDFLKDGSIGDGWTVDPPFKDIWPIVDDMLTMDEQTDVANPFALRPERFAKFSRIRVGGDYPVDFRMVYSYQFQRDLLLFKAGPHVSGVVAPILRGRLAETFKDEPEVFW